MDIFNWLSSSNSSDTAKDHPPPLCFHSPTGSNVLEIPPAKQTTAAHDGPVSFTNIYNELAGKAPQFNMFAAVEPKAPDANLTASPLLNGACDQSDTHNGQGGKTYKFIVNQPTPNDNVPLIQHQGGDEHGIDNTISHQDGDEHGIDNTISHQDGNEHGIDNTISHQDGNERTVDNRINHQDHRLDCAKVVSDTLHQIDPRIAVTTNLAHLQHELTRHGWEQVAKDPKQFDPQALQPGDVIAGRRLPGMPGHAAIYLGGKMIYNNNSDSGQPVVESVDKFLQHQYREDGSFNKNGYSDIKVYRNKSDTYRKAEVSGLLKEIPEID